MSIFMFFMAVLPAALLMYFVYKADKIEKEPAGLLVKLFLFGLLSTLSALVLEILGELILRLIFPYGGLAYTALMMFCVVALSEEAGKYFVVKKVAWKDPAFNYTFDAVVYAVFSSLGFAALENVMYLTDAPIITAIMRGILAVPGHAIDAVFMGSYFGAAKRCEAIGDEKGKKANLIKALVVPVIIHGFYDFCLSCDIPYAIVIFFIFEIFITIYAIMKVKKLSSSDSAIFPMGYYPGAQVAYQMYNQGALRFDPMTGQPIYVAQPQPMVQPMGFDPMTGQPIMQQAQPQFQAQPMGFDPMTGQPIMQQAQPQFQAQPQMQAPVQQAQPMGFDPMTGQPIMQQAQPQFQAQPQMQAPVQQSQPMGFDPMTGQPIMQQAQPQSGMHFDPMTGQPIMQQAQPQFQAQAQPQFQQAVAQETSAQQPEKQAVAQETSVQQAPVQEAPVQQAEKQAPAQETAVAQSQPVMHFDPMTGQPIMQQTQAQSQAPVQETVQQAPVQEAPVQQVEIQAQTVLKDSVPVQDQVFESENPTQELAPNVVSSANYDPMTGRPIEPSFAPEA
ncbi:PrsW family intramembrane metalloprotease [Butyrivibrio sp. INlla14]|uniref:PrsW family intramembrane metalloprotease n=1 Tax=Butyrivibrio sp. INlla14 TaxID=1520808 RepID=UPI000876A5A8|nr:PrsW family intramembrane metalloprotease [Butyrivibrio sp. INlla14]SCY19657.1 Membrane proteinase PrsW, cleaves anti-sigma factor RsiW, M82 family [Butyrivibrio sp. INlla14]